MLANASVAEALTHWRNNRVSVEATEEGGSKFFLMPTGSYAGLPRLVEVRSFLTRDFAGGSEPFQRAMISFARLPYALDGAGLALLDLANAVPAAAQQTLDAVQAASGLVMMPERQRNFLGHRVDACLSTLVRVQDALIPVIGRIAPHSERGVSLESSMSGLMKQLENGKVKLPAGLGALYAGYWSEHGALLRTYRDEAEHRGLLLPECNVLRVGVSVRITMPLPLNPDTKSVFAYEYGPPHRDAWTYLADEFLALLELANATLAECKMSAEDRKQVSFVVSLRASAAFGKDAAASISGLPDWADLNRRANTIVERHAAG